MKKNSLTTALMAGLAGIAGLASTASAVNVNPDGIGQVLLFPYYTVNKNNATLISVVNTTNRVKAVKVRFLEGRNSQEVLDFHLYLSPFDVWTGNINSPTGATGPASVFTNDTSCTVPKIWQGQAPATRVGSGTPETWRVDFVDYEYSTANGSQDWDSDGTPSSLVTLLDSIERTREGHIEMIEMGNLQTGTLATQLAEEATHTASGIPTNCGALVASWVNPNTGTRSWAPGASGVGGLHFGWLDIDVPSGGIFGSAAIINVPDGTMHAYNAEAIEGFYTNVGSNGTGTPSSGSATSAVGSSDAIEGQLHYPPGEIKPDLEDGDTSSGSKTFPATLGSGESYRTVDAYVFANNGSSIIQERMYQGINSGSLVVHIPGATVCGETSTTVVWFGYGCLPTLASNTGSLGRPISASIDAVSTVLMHDSIYNEYNSELALAASSEWIITYPTKRYYVNYQARTLTGVDVSPSNPGYIMARAPFTDSFYDNGTSCDEVRIRYWNREESVQGTTPGSVFFSPRPHDRQGVNPVICYEANVISFNQNAVGTGSPTNIFGSSLAYNLATRIAASGTSVYENGWAAFTFIGRSVAAPPVGSRPGLGGVRSNRLYADPNTLDADNVPQGSVFAGLPVIGFWSINYVNGQVAPGVLANFSGAFRHRGSRSCIAGTGAGACDNTFNIP